MGSTTNQFSKTSPVTDEVECALSEAGSVADRKPALASQNIAKLYQSAQSTMAEETH